MQSVQALLAVQAKLAGLAVAATYLWAGTGRGRMPEGGGGSTSGTHYQPFQIPGCAQPGHPAVAGSERNRSRTRRAGRRTGVAALGLMRTILGVLARVHTC